MKRDSRTKPPVSRARLIFIVGIVLLLLMVFVITHHKKGPEAQSGKAGQKPVPVVLTRVVSQTMPVEIKTIGNVESVSNVTIKPQIDGPVTGVYFKEGDFVHKGQLLFSIDPKPIEATVTQAQAVVSRDLAAVAQARSQYAKSVAAVHQAEAIMKRDQAQVAYAVAQEGRYKTLVSQQLVSQSEYDQVLASRRAAEETVNADRAAVHDAEAVAESDRVAIQSAEANVMADQAQVQSARIQLAYCFIKAPMAGRTGSLKVHPGDAVEKNSTEMLTLQQMNPINVGFSIPEQSLDQIKQRVESKPYVVSVKTKENPPETLTGHLNFMENIVDTTTGTIRLKASFQNDNKLWPGQYVDVTIYLAEQADALVIPAQAVQSGQTGDYVFVADGNKAKLRPVIVNRIIDNQAVVTSGLRVGEAVVTDGQFQLSPDALIKPKETSRAR